MFRIAFLVALAFVNAAIAAEPAPDLAAQLAAAPGRSDEDKARDAQRKPAQVLAFLGLKPGDTALDVWAAGGWYTEVLSIAVGPTGHVYSQNPPMVLQFRDGAYDKALAERLAGDRLANVERVDEALTDEPLPADSIDFAITAMNFHDVYNSDGADAGQAFMEEVFFALRPGGVFGVIDHVGVAGADNKKLHRIEPEKAKQAALAAGFVIEAESDLLAHPEDDHTKNVFDPDVRGKTDRFLLKLRKPDE
jgi:predicted methyltransferase